MPEIIKNANEISELVYDIEHKKHKKYKNNFKKRRQLQILKH